MTPKTQSVCKHCGHNEKHELHHSSADGFWQIDHVFESVSEPASTGEQPVSQEVADHNKYGVMRPRGGALRPSRPRSLDRTTAVDVAGEIDYMKSVEDAPQPRPLFMWQDPIKHSNCYGFKLETLAGCPNNADFYVRCSKCKTIFSCLAISE